MKIFLQVVLIFLSFEACAKDLGVYGEVWQIKEKDALQEIMDKLSDMESKGEIEEQNKKFAEKVKKKLLRPAPVKGIRTTTNPREFIYEPVVSYPKDLKNHKGEVFYKAGTLVNSLDHVFMPYELLFIDGDDEKQLIWALDKHKKAQFKPLIILVKGEPIRLTEEYNIDFYYDQFGVMTKRLQIKQVPAVAKQEDKHLKIREIMLQCTKNEIGEEGCQER